MYIGAIVGITALGVMFVEASLWPFGQPLTVFGLVDGESRFGLGCYSSRFSSSVGPEIRASRICSCIAGLRGYFVSVLQPLAVGRIFRVGYSERAATRISRTSASSGIRGVLPSTGS